MTTTQGSTIEEPTEKLLTDAWSSGCTEQQEDEIAVSPWHVLISAIQ